MTTVQAIAIVLAKNLKFETPSTALKRPFPPRKMERRMQAAAKTKITLERPWYHMFSSSDDDPG
jgi:hypothetical protein